jgi:multiple sugar transport system substrate-binding protein
MPIHKLLRFSLLLALALLVGCGDKTKDDNAVIQINFWNGFSGPDGQQMEKIVRQFNDEHRGRIQVRMQIIPWGTFYDKVTLGLAFGGAPEVFVLHVNRFPEFANHNVLGRIDDLVKRDGPPEADFVSAPWKATFWKGEQRGLPLDCHPLGLFYNLDLFQKAGIERPPTNLVEFKDAARKLTIDKNGDGQSDQWGFAFTWLHSNSYCFMNQFGASLLSPDLGKSGMSTPETDAAMECMSDLIDSKVCPRPEGQDAWLGFQTGKVAMAMEGVYMMTSLTKQKGLRFAAAPVPQFGTKKAVWAGSHLLTMPAKLSSAKREAAWTFMRYLSDHSIIWAEGGQVPVRKSILQTPRFKALPIQSEFAKQLDYVVFEPQSVNYNLVATFGDSAFEAILNQTQSPTTALETASRRINNVLERQ